MRIQALTISALLTSSVFGQTATEQTREFHLTNAAQAATLSEAGTAIRTITEMRQVQEDLSKQTITARGTIDQLDLADWILVQIDRAPGENPGTAAHERRVSPNADDFIRVLYVTSGKTAQDFQQIAALVRTLGDIRRAITYNGSKALILRGTSEQMALAEWLVRGLGHSATLESHEYKMAPLNEGGDNTNVVHIRWLGGTLTPQELQEEATLARTMSDIRRAFIYNGGNALALRGTAEQVALAEWLLNEIDAPTNAEYHTATPNRKGTDIVRVFFIPATATPADFQKVALNIKTTAQIRYAFTYTSKRALALRGSRDQMATAERMIRELEIRQ
jgi:hypothetical protein